MRSARKSRSSCALGSKTPKAATHHACKALLGPPGQTCGQNWGQRVQQALEPPRRLQGNELMPRVGSDGGASLPWPRTPWAPGPVAGHSRASHPSLGTRSSCRRATRPLRQSPQEPEKASDPTGHMGRSCGHCLQVRPSAPRGACTSGWRQDDNLPWGAPARPPRFSVDTYQPRCGKRQPEWRSPKPLITKREEGSACRAHQRL